MITIRAKVSKTIQESPYSPFNAELEMVKEINSSEDDFCIEQLDELEQKLENLVDHIISSRLEGA